MEPDFDSSDPFELLGIPSDSDKQAIRKAYKALIRQFRPETHPDEFQKIRGAYDEALVSMTWRSETAGWEDGSEGPDEDAVFGEEDWNYRDHVGNTDESEDIDSADDDEEEDQVFEAVFDKPWPEDDELRIELPLDSRLANFLGYAAWTDRAYLQHGLEIESLLKSSGAHAARLRFEALEQELEGELGDEQGRLTWLRLGTFLVRALAPSGDAKELDRILKKVDDEQDLDEECFDTLEFAIVILRARAEIEKASKLKYPTWFTSFVLDHVDSDPAEINQGLADIRRRLLSLRKKRDIDWLDQLTDDLPNFGTLFHILMQRHAEGLIGIIDEGDLQPESSKPWDLQIMDRDLMQLEAELERGRPRHVILNAIVTVTFGASSIGFLVFWLIGIFGDERFSYAITLPLLALAWILRGCVDRSYAYRFLLRPKLRRFLDRHDAPIAVLTALIRTRDPSLPGLDYYLTAIETDPRLPPCYHKRHIKHADIPLPYLGNLAPR